MEDITGADAAPAYGDKPAESGEQPADSGEQPAESGEQPAESGEQPAEFGEQPAPVQDESDCLFVVQSGEQPAEYGEQPATVQDESDCLFAVQSGDKPAESGEQPAECGVQPAEYGEQSAESGEQSPSVRDESKSLYVVQCAPETDPWTRFTCLLALWSAFVCNGVLMSLFLFDGRVGATGMVPAEARTLEHVAVYALLFYGVGPLACALVNRHGFRPMLLVGSLMSVTWSACLWSVPDVFIDYRGLLLAAVGGTGAGLMNKTFTILLSSLFNVKRQKAHLHFHLGTFAGIMTVVPLIETCITVMGSNTALLVNMILTTSTLVFWLAIVTPVPLKLEGLATHPKAKKIDVPTLWNALGNQHLRVIPFTSHTMRSSGWPQRLCTVEKSQMYRSVVNLFGPNLVGNRPIYRDDILFTGNIFHLVDEKLKGKECIYPMLMTRTMTASDVQDELTGWTTLCPTSVKRTFDTMMRPNILKNVTFLLYATSEFLIHAARFLPLVFIKGPTGMKKPTDEAVYTVIAGCYGMLTGRGLGFVMHETTATPVPINTVSIVLIANGLSLFMSTTTDFGLILPCFGIYGFLFGYLHSVQNALVYNVFPVHRLNNVDGYVSLVRGLGSCIGILVAVLLQENSGTSNRVVFVYAGMLMLAAGICAGVLQATVNNKLVAQNKAGMLVYTDIVHPTGLAAKKKAWPPIDLLP